MFLSYKSKMSYFNPDEELLTRRQDNGDRFCLFPIQYKDIYDMYKKNESCFWTTEEIDFTQDINDYNSLTDNEKYFLENILGFFASSDNIVIERLTPNGFSISMAISLRPTNAVTMKKVKMTAAYHVLV